MSPVALAVLNSRVLTASLNTQSAKKWNSCWSTCHNTIKLKPTVIVSAVISLTTYSMFHTMTTMTRWSFGEEDCFLVYSILPGTLSRSASSVPVESMLSTKGLLVYYLMENVPPLHLTEPTGWHSFTITTLCTLTLTCKCIICVFSGVSWDYRVLYCGWMDNDWFLQLMPFVHFLSFNTLHVT